MSERFDYVVIGGGSGGIASARRAASHGARVALVDKGPIGGTCVNVGCVPKKVMWNAGGIADALADAPYYGFDVNRRSFDWRRLKAARDAYVDRLTRIYAEALARDGVTYVSGRGRLARSSEEQRRVDVGDRFLLAEHVLIATGGRPRVPPIQGAELGITSDGFFALDEQPRRVAIVGAGYIAVEIAGVFHALGTDVTVILRYGEFLRGFDSTLRQGLMAQMTEEGVSFLTCEEVARLYRGDDSLLHLQTKAGRASGGYDAVVWAVGRNPNTEDLGVVDAGVELGPEGHVVVDAYQNTSAAGVYAVGDVTGQKELTPVAIAAGRRLSDRLFGGQPDARLDYTDVPTVIFSHPPIGTVGLSEEEAQKQYGDALKVYSAQYTNMVHALKERRPKTLVKLLTVLPDEKIVGIHMLGPAADEVIQGFAVAVRMGARKSDLDRTVAIHPTAAEELVTLR